METPGDEGDPARAVAGRVCVLRKSAEATRLAHRKVRRDAARQGNRVQAATLRFAEYVIVFRSTGAEVPETLAGSCPSPKRTSEGGPVGITPY